MQEFDYTVIRKPRRRSASIQVTRDNRISISVPSWLSEKEVKEILSRKGDWIRKQIERNQALRAQTKPRTFSHGENFPFLGRMRPLHLAGARELDSAAPDSICIAVPPCEENSRADLVKEELCRWYRDQAENIFAERIVIYENALGVKARTVKIREARSRWGSCNTRDVINLNWKLVMAPLEIVDYVLVHELAHMLHMDHSPRFWARVASVIPDYKRRRRWLSDHGGTLSLE